jgi:outer membrane lipoprotein-sorting protein
MSRAWMRWLPAAAVPAVIAAGVLAGSIPVWAGDPLPEKTPAQVLALWTEHGTQQFSGTLEQASELGLPELPATGPTSGPASAGGAASIAELLTGQHTARVYVDGTAKVRIQVVDRLAERDVIRRDSDLWFYSSRDNTAAHLTLPAIARDLPKSQPQTPAYPTPEALASRLLAKVDGSTAVTVGPDVEVAGRTAYNLVLEPRTQGTLLGKAAIAVDGKTGMPLRVSVTARGQSEPAFQVGFTSLSLEVPDDSLFSFVPPPGATVKELQLPPVPMWPVTPMLPPAPGVPGVIPGFPGSPGVTPDQPSVTPPSEAKPPEITAPDSKPPDSTAPETVPPDSTPPEATAPEPPETRESLPPTLTRPVPAWPSITGSGWETVIGFQAGQAGQGSVLSESLLNDPFLSQAAVVVPGGRLLSTALVNVLFTDDGRIFIGMVPPERLQAAAGAVAP